MRKFCLAVLVNDRTLWVENDKCGVGVKIVSLMLECAACAEESVEIVIIKEN
jgi:hypothetical protein